MKCSEHPDRDAAAICVACGRGVCAESIAPSSDSVCGRAECRAVVATAFASRSRPSEAPQPRRQRIAPWPVWDGSIVTWVARAFVAIAQWASLLTYVAWFRQNSNVLDDTGDPLPKDLVELWLLAVLIAEAVALFAMNPASPGVIVYIVAGFGIIDTIRHVIDDVAVMPEIRDPPRWLLMAPLSVLEAIIGFAILNLAHGDGFKEPLSDPLTALYYTFVTTSTLGYGDHVPIGTYAKSLVVIEIAMMMAFLGLKLAIAVSVWKHTVRAPDASADSPNT